MHDLVFCHYCRPSDELLHHDVGVVRLKGLIILLEGETSIEKSFLIPQSEAYCDVRRIKNVFDALN